jgi:hypothetical protein
MRLFLLGITGTNLMLGFAFDLGFVPIFCNAKLDLGFVCGTKLDWELWPG